jgi:hypothetical protein
MKVTENVASESLNNLFSRTVMFYFSNQRSGAANALTTFFLHDPKVEISFDSIAVGRYKSLSDRRNELVSALPSSTLAHKSGKSNLSPGGS